MTAPTFARATKRQARARVALVGPSGSGKTYTALTFATGLGGRIAVIDTERGSASKYADLFTFDTLELDTYDPRTYVQAIDAAAAAGYDILIIDSLSHAWTGKGGALELVDNAAKRSQSNNSYTAWRDVTPLHNRLVDAIIGAPMHVIATMRAKSEYVLEQVRRDGRTVNVPKKVGMAPIQRDGMEYEFDIVADLTLDLDFVVSKSRCPAFTGAVINRPDVQVAETLKAWLSDGQPEMSEGAGERAGGRDAGKRPATTPGSGSDEPATTPAPSDTNGSPEAPAPPSGEPLLRELAAIAARRGHNLNKLANEARRTARAGGEGLPSRLATFQRLDKLPVEDLALIAAWARGEQDPTPDDGLGDTLAADKPTAEVGS